MLRRPESALVDSVPEDCKPEQKRKVPLMIGTIVLALTLLLGSASTTPGPVNAAPGSPTPAGGIPIPQVAAGAK